MNALVLLVEGDPSWVTSPTVVAPTAIAVVIAFAWLVVKVLSIGTQASDAAADTAASLVKPLQAEVDRLTKEVAQCKAESMSERLWSQILVARLEGIIRDNGGSIPPETWVRP